MLPRKGGKSQRSNLLVTPEISKWPLPRRQAACAFGCGEKSFDASNVREPAETSASRRTNRTSPL